MIHLFKKVYISLDVFGVFNNTSSERLYITNAEFPVPITADRRLRTECRILGVYSNLQEIDKELGGRDKVWEMLYGSDRAIVIIADLTTANELCAQFWKSLFVDATPKSLYALHQLTANSENLLAIADSRISEKTGIRVGDVGKRIVPLMNEEDFDSLTKSLSEVDLIKSIRREDLSIEFSLASYLINPDSERNKKVLFDKMEYIVTKAYLETFVDLAMTLHRRFASLNRTEYDAMDVALCPFENMKKIPALQWTFKKSILSRDMDAVAKDFSIRKTIDIYKEINELDIFVSAEKNKDLVHIGEMILSKDFTAIIEEDMRAQKRSSLFSDSRFREKVNPLLTSYLYRLKRLEKTDELKAFVIR